MRAEIRRRDQAPQQTRRFRQGRMFLESSRVPRHDQARRRRLVRYPWRPIYGYSAALVDPLAAFAGGAESHRPRGFSDQLFHT